MPGKIILINTNRMRPRVAPIGLDYVAGALRSAGAEVRFFDLALAPRGWTFPLKKLLDEFKPDLVGVTVRNIDDCYFLSGSFLLRPVKRLVSWLKQNSGAKIVLGGVGYSIAPLALLDYLGADYGVWGDGEDVIVKLLKSVAKGRQPMAEDIPGLVTKDAVALQRSELDPDRFRLNRKLADNSLYFRMGGQVGIETKRGCTGKCIYCADPLAKGRKVRSRSAESVADEMEELLSYGAWAFHLCDSEFNRGRNHAEQVLSEIVKRGLGEKISLYGYFSPKPFDLDLAKLFVSAGGKGICFGADSGSDELLSILKRDHSARDLETVVIACKKAGVRIMYDLLIGGPNENKKTMAHTIRLMKKLKPDRVGVSYGLRVYAGTALAQMVKAEQSACAAGSMHDNPELIFPVFYLSPALQKDGLDYLHGLVGNDKRFFLPAQVSKKQNYNYSGNLFLEQLIKKGARGAYWKILLDAHS